MARTKDTKRKLEAAAAAAEHEDGEEEEEEEEEEEGPPCSQEVEAGGSTESPKKKRWRIDVRAVIAAAGAKDTTPDVYLARYLKTYTNKNAKDLGFMHLPAEDLEMLNGAFAEAVAWEPAAIGRNIGKMHGRIMRLVDEMMQQEEEAAPAAAPAPSGSRNARSEARAASAAAAAAAAQEEERARLGELYRQWLDFLQTVNTANFGMLATFMELPQLDPKFNPNWNNNGKLRIQMEAMKGPRALGIIKGVGMLEPGRQAEFRELVEKEKQELAARAEERAGRRKILDDREAELRRDVAKVHEALRLTMWRWPTAKDVTPLLLQEPYTWSTDEKNLGVPLGVVEVGWYTAKLGGYMDISPSGGDKMDWAKVPGACAQLEPGARAL